jgi:hypothetical protein
MCRWGIASCSWRAGLSVYRDILRGGCMYGADLAAKIWKDFQQQRKDSRPAPNPRLERARELAHLWWIEPWPVHERKPHIAFRKGLWVCKRHGDTGAGYSPEDAYVNWKGCYGDGM